MSQFDFYISIRDESGDQVALEGPITAPLTDEGEFDWAAEVAVLTRALQLVGTRAEKELGHDRHL